MSKNRKIIMLVCTEEKEKKNKSIYYTIKNKKNKNKLKLKKFNYFIRKRTLHKEI
ncbi:MAG: 50S ribosomal protein L33 [Candidatus Shikimatogenerans bostrichidophilus]|nr:MAG: 50S ribosomal protein L33 [Candidatus Shikimatogenerans bostrichidophilus]